MMTAKDTIFYDPDTRRLLCKGDWYLNTIPELKSLLKKISWPDSGEVTVDGSAVSKMDSAGAWLLIEWQNKLKQQKVKVHLQKFSKQHQTLLELIDKQCEVEEETELSEIKEPNWLARVGIYATKQYKEFLEYLTFVGHLTFEFLRILRKPTRLRWESFSGVVYRNGYQALPIIALLSFMIGVVMAYQMGLQLLNYGANIFIVDFVGLSVLREFGPLLTSIMIAGRTGSSFTAQLGIMKINQEIDALDTLGVTPAELIILPRIIGLFIALPLLTIWSDIFCLIGGMIMSNSMLNIGGYEFLHRFHQVIPLRALLIGLGKAPVFALIIASIGCFQGVQVEKNAASVGRNTTRSVVLAIFFIIVVDAIFSVVFSKLKL